MKVIKISGIANIERLDVYFSSTMVDIAHFDEINEHEVVLVLEPDIDLENANDREWILDLVNNALKECKETSAKIELIEE